MAERIPETMGDSAHERQHVARLRFVPDSILFEHLRGFYRSPESLRKVGRQGLILYSVHYIPVTRYPSHVSWESGSRTMSMPEVDRVDSELKHLGTNDQHMVMTDLLRFAPLSNRGIAIHMSVQLNNTVINKLHGTPFIDEDGTSVPVRLKLVDGEHAPGGEMQKVAHTLDNTLKSDKYPRPGVESLGIRIM